jgi:IS5 family transposase
VRDIERKRESMPVIDAHFAQTLAIAHRIHAQRRDDTHKVYSTHALEVECLAKGKAHKPYEFGVTVSVVSTNRDNFVAGMQSVPGNPYDGHTLQGAIEQVTALTGITPEQAYVDRGYRGHKLESLSV